MKWVIYGVLAFALAIGWVAYQRSGQDEQKELAAEIERIDQSGTLDELEELPTLRDKLASLKDEKALTGVLLAFVTAGALGVAFVIDVLPAIAHRFTHAVYDSAEEVEEDVMHDARSKLAQGDYDGAVAAFRDAAAQDPMNRVPWVEIARIQREHLQQPAAAVATLREAIEGQEWEVNDAAFLMFRLAEIYDEGMHDRHSAALIMQQVADQFPESRHSANAKHRLHEWGLA